MIVANGDDANVQTLRADARARWLTFGTSRGCDIFATDPEYTPEGSAFTAWWEGREWFRFRTTMSGAHNVVNALADIAIARLRGLSAEEIQRGLETFQGIKRRMEVRGVERGVTVIDDFAHHPTAIATTLAGAQDGAIPGSASGPSSSHARSHRAARNSSAATSRLSIRPAALSSGPSSTRVATRRVMGSTR